MSTPYMAFSSLLRNALAVFWTLWLTAFVIVRVYALHEAYVAEAGKRSDERWLLEKCQDLEFYANLRQHSNLCTEVQTLFSLFWGVSSCVYSLSLTHTLMHLSTLGVSSYVYSHIHRCISGIQQCAIQSAAQVAEQGSLGARHQPVWQEHLPRAGVCCSLPAGLAGSSCAGSLTHRGPQPDPDPPALYVRNSDAGRRSCPMRTLTILCVVDLFWPTMTCPALALKILCVVGLICPTMMLFGAGKKKDDPELAVVSASSPAIFCSGPYGDADHQQQRMLSRSVLHCHLGKHGLLMVMVLTGGGG